MRLKPNKSIAYDAEDGREVFWRRLPGSHAGAARKTERAKRAKCKSVMPKKGAQAGFSLVELLVALGVMAIIGAASVFAFDFNRSKAQSVYQTAVEIREAVERFTLDTSCFPGLIDVLWNRKISTNSASNDCGENLYSVWNGPYMKPLQMVGPQWARLPQYGPYSYVMIQKYTMPGLMHGGLLEQFFLPRGVTYQFASELKQAGVRYILGGTYNGSEAIAVFWPEF